MPVSEEAKKAAAEKAAAAKKAAGKASAATKKTASTAKKTVKKEVAPAAEEAVKEVKEEVKEVVEEPVEEKKSAAANFKAPTTADLKKVKTLRIVAIVLWVLALACEIGAFFILNRGVKNVVVENGTVIGNAFQVNGALSLASMEAKLMLGVLILDLVFCIIAAQLWKKSNAISPCLAKSALVRTLWHQLGVIMLLVCFLPIGIVLVCKSKKLNKKSKTILIAALSAAFIAATASNVDYKQPNSEEVQQIRQEMINIAGDNDVYWTKFGYAYHLDKDCSHIRGKVPVADGGTLMSGTLDDALAANRFDPCADCAGVDKIPQNTDAELENAA